MVLAGSGERGGVGAVGRSRAGAWSGGRGGRGGGSRERGVVGGR